jgi:hypothetical protein
MMLAIQPAYLSTVLRPVWTASTGQALRGALAS